MNNDKHSKDSEEKDSTSSRSINAATLEAYEASIQVRERAIEEAQVRVEPRPAESSTDWMYRSTEVKVDLNSISKTIDLRTKYPVTKLDLVKDFRIDEEITSHFNVRHSPIDDMIRYPERLCCYHQGQILLLGTTVIPPSLKDIYDHWLSERDIDDIVNSGSPISGYNVIKQGRLQCPIPEVSKIAFDERISSLEREKSNLKSSVHGLTYMSNMVAMFRNRGPLETVDTTPNYFRYFVNGVPVPNHDIYELDLVPNDHYQSRVNAENLLFRFVYMTEPLEPVIRRRLLGFGGVLYDQPRYTPGDGSTQAELTAVVFKRRYFQEQIDAEGLPRGRKFNYYADAHLPEEFASIAANSGSHYVPFGSNNLEPHTVVKSQDKKNNENVDWCSNLWVCGKSEGIDFASTIATFLSCKFTSLLKLEYENVVSCRPEVATSVVMNIYCSYIFIPSTCFANNLSNVESIFLGLNYTQTSRVSATAVLNRVAAQAGLAPNAIAPAIGAPRPRQGRNARQINGAQNGQIGEEEEIIDACAQALDLDRWVLVGVRHSLIDKGVTYMPKGHPYIESVIEDGVERHYFKAKFPIVTLPDLYTMARPFVRLFKAMDHGVNNDSSCPLGKVMIARHRVVCQATNRAFYSPSTRFVALYLFELYAGVARNFIKNEVIAPHFLTDIFAESLTDVPYMTTLEPLNAGLCKSFIIHGVGKSFSTESYVPSGTSSIVEPSPHEDNSMCEFQYLNTLQLMAYEHLTYIIQKYYDRSINHPHDIRLKYINYMALNIFQKMYNITSEDNIKTFIKLWFDKTVNHRFEQGPRLGGDVVEAYLTVFNNRPKFAYCISNHYYQHTIPVPYSYAFYRTYVPSNEIDANHLRVLSGQDIVDFLRNNYGDSNFDLRLDPFNVRERIAGFNEFRLNALQANSQVVGLFPGLMEPEGRRMAHARIIESFRSRVYVPSPPTRTILRIENLNVRRDIMFPHVIWNVTTTNGTVTKPSVDVDPKSRGPSISMSEIIPTQTECARALSESRFFIKPVILDYVIREVDNTPDFVMLSNTTQITTDQNVLGELNIVNNNEPPGFRISFDFTGTIMDSDFARNHLNRRFRPNVVFSFKKVVGSGVKFIVIDEDKMIRGVKMS